VCGSKFIYGAIGYSYFPHILTLFFIWC